MKLVWVGICLFLATATLSLACGPKEKYCYAEKLTCNDVARAIAADALFEAPEVEAEAGTTCFSSTGDPIPCPG